MSLVHPTDRDLLTALGQNNIDLHQIRVRGLEFGTGQHYSTQAAEVLLSRARAYDLYPTRQSGFFPTLLVRNSCQQSTADVLPGPTDRNRGCYLYDKAQHPGMLSQQMRSWESSRKKTLYSKKLSQIEFEEKNSLLEKAKSNRVRGEKLSTRKS